MGGALDAECLDYEREGVAIRSSPIAAFICPNCLHADARAFGKLFLRESGLHAQSFEECPEPGDWAGGRGLGTWQGRLALLSGLICPKLPRSQPPFLCQSTLTV